MSTFVSVGNANQPFHRLLKAVDLLAQQKEFPQPVVVQHGFTPFRSEFCISKDFMSMEAFAEQIYASDLLILHAGAGSMIHACKAGKVPVVAPRRVCFGEHIDDHQVELVEAFVQMGMVVRVDDMKKLSSAARKAVTIQEKKGKYTSNGASMIDLVKRVLADIDKQTHCR